MDDPATRKLPMSSTMSQIHHPVPLYLARKEPSPSAQSARGNAHLILDPDQSYISSLVSKPRASPQKEWKVATIKIIKAVAGATAIIGTALAINYAVRSYRLAQWTAAKDFMQQCQNAQNPPDLCHGLEDKVLGPPPYASNDYYVDSGQKRVSSLIGRERPNTGRDVNLPLANTEVNDASSYHPILLLVILLTLASLKFIVPFLKQRSYLHRNWISGEDRLVPWLGPYGRLRNGQIPEHVDNGISSSVDLASIPDRPILRLRHGRMRDLCARPPNIKVETKFTAATVETAEQVVHSQAQFISSSINMAKEIQFTINSLDVTNETAKGYGSILPKRLIDELAFLQASQQNLRLKSPLGHREPYLETDLLHTLDMPQLFMPFGVQQVLTGQGIQPEDEVTIHYRLYNHNFTVVEEVKLWTHKKEDQNVVEEID